MSIMSIWPGMENIKFEKKNWFVIYKDASFEAYFLLHACFSINNKKIREVHFGMDGYTYKTRREEYWISKGHM